MKNYLCGDPAQQDERSRAIRDRFRLLEAWADPKKKLRPSEVDRLLRRIRRGGW